MALTNILLIIRVLVNIDDSLQNLLDLIIVRMIIICCCY